MQPRLETVRVAQARELSPADDQGLLYGVLCASDITEDPLRDRHEPVGLRSGQDGEGIPVAALGLLDEIALQLTDLRGIRVGRLPTPMSR